MYRAKRRVDMSGMWYSAGGGAVALGLSESGEGREEGE